MGDECLAFESTDDGLVIATTFHRPDDDYKVVFVFNLGALPAGDVEISGGDRMFMQPWGPSELLSADTMGSSQVSVSRLVQYHDLLIARIEWKELGRWGVRELFFIGADSAKAWLNDEQEVECRLTWSTTNAHTHVTIALPSTAEGALAYSSARDIEK